MSDDCKTISITENHFSYTISNYQGNVYISAKSDIDKRIWKINIVSDTSGDELGIKSELIYQILEDYSKGIEDLKRYYLVEFPSTPKDKTGDLMIVIRAISFYNSEEKIYRILLKLQPIDNIERLEERISELRYQQSHSEAIMNVYRGIINDQDKTIKKLTNNVTKLTETIEDYANNFRILTQTYGFKFTENTEVDPIERFASPAPLETETVHASSNPSEPTADMYITNSIAQQIDVCTTRIDALEAELEEARVSYQQLVQLVTNTNESFSEEVQSIKETVDDNNEVYRDNLTKINSTIILHNEEINSMKSTVENTQKAGIYSKKHIDRINERLTRIGELVNTKFADTSRRIKEDYLISRSPTGSWGSDLMAQHMNSK